MRALLHVASFILLLPSLVFAAGYAILGHAIAGATLLQVFLRLLYDALWLASGGALIIAAVMLAVLVGGFFGRTRYLASAAVAILALVSGIVLIALGSQPFSGGRGLFLVPGLVSLAVSGSLARKEWPSQVRIAGADSNWRADD